MQQWQIATRATTHNITHCWTARTTVSQLDLSFSSSYCSER